MTTIGSYQLIRPIGAGGMARVFEALDPATGRHVAVKMLADHATDPDDFQRFQREGEVVRRLSHPNIITIYAIGDAGGRPFIAMELLRDGSLEDRLRQHGPYAPKEAVRLMIPVLEALDHAHSHGLVHRDLKPANVLLRPDGTPVLADFDLARSQRPDPRSRITQEGELLGTPAYMAPEQLRGGELDGRTDIYACGAMLFEMLTGRPPFEGDLTQTIVGHLQQPAPSLRSLLPHVPPELDQLVGRMLAKAPVDRPFSAKVAIRELRASVKTRKPSRRAMPSAGSLPPGTTVQPRPASPAVPQPLQVRPRIAGATLAIGLFGGIVLLSMLFVVIFQIDRNRQLAPALTSEPPISATIETIVEIETSIAIEIEIDPTPRPPPGPTSTSQATIAAVPDGLASIGSPLLTDAQTVVGANGTTYIVGSVGMTPVGDTGVLLLFGELLAEQAGGQAVVTVDLLDAEGRTIASGSGATLDPFAEPWLTSAFIVVVVPGESMDAAAIAGTAFSVERLPAGEQRALLLDVAPEPAIERLDSAAISYRLAGEVVNTSEESLSGVRIIALLYDPEGRVVSIEDNSRDLDGARLSPGDRVDFEITLLSLANEVIGYRVYALGIPTE